MSVNQPSRAFFRRGRKRTKIQEAITNLRSKQMIKKFFRDETGLELSEYAVAAALVAIAVVGAFTALGTAISGKITSLGATISK
jgi:pilus assembly protein Flp/PilA